MTPCPKSKTFHSAKYQAYVRKKPCWGCGCRRRIEFHHESKISNENGMGMKVSDKFGIPLCWDCHHIRHHIGAVTFWGEDRLKTLPGECLQLYNEFLSLGGKF